jgi:hypothetical protein
MKSKAKVFALTYNSEGELLTPKEDLPKCFQNGNHSKLTELFKPSKERIQKLLNSLKNGYFYSIKNVISLDDEAVTFVIKSDFRY